MKYKIQYLCADFCVKDRQEKKRKFYSKKSLELYKSNLSSINITKNQDKLIIERTAELQDAKNIAIAS